MVEGLELMVEGQGTCVGAGRGRRGREGQAGAVGGRQGQ